MEENNKLFVGGDLSGIQKYLYNISSHKAAVSLKGRSAKLCDYMNVWCKKIESAATKAGAKKVARFIVLVVSSTLLLIYLRIARP